MTTLILHAMITSFKLKSANRVTIQMVTQDGQEVDLIDVTMGLTPEVLEYQIGNEVTISVSKREKIIQ